MKILTTITKIIGGLTVFILDLIVLALLIGQVRYITIGWQTPSFGLFIWGIFSVFLTFFWAAFPIGRLLQRFWFWMNGNEEEDIFLGYGPSYRRITYRREEYKFHITISAVLTGLTFSTFSFSLLTETVSRLAEWFEGRGAAGEFLYRLGVLSLMFTAAIALWRRYKKTYKNLKEDDEALEEQKKKYDYKIF